MTDVHDLLTGTQRALQAAEPPLDAAQRAALLAGTRRRRRRRHATQTLGVATVVLAIGAGAWLGTHRDAAPQPATSPTATAAPEPTPSPSSPAPAPPAPVVVDRAGAPLLHELPPGVLESAGTGWVLAQYTPLDQDPAAASLLALLDPQGVAYLVSDLPTSDVLVVDWRPGAPTATVVMPAPDGPAGRRGVLDLRSGTATPDAAGLGDVSPDGFVGRRADGAELWWVRAGDGDVELWSLRDGQATPVGARVPSGRHRGAVLSPDGTRLALVGLSGRGDAAGGYFADSSPVVDVRTGATTDVLLDPDGGECLPEAWLDPTTVLARCVEHAPLADPDVEAADVIRTWFTEATLDGDVRVHGADAAAGGATGGATVVLGSLGGGDEPLHGATARLWHPGQGPGPVTATLDVPEVTLEARPAGPGRVVVATGTSPEDPYLLDLWSLDARTGEVVRIGPHGEGPEPLHATRWVVAP